VLEVKCPYCLADEESSIEEYLKKNKCIKKIGDFFEWNKNHSYYFQIQLQMLMSSRSFADFIVWKRNGFLILREEIDKEFLVENIEKAQRFFYQIIMPELLAGYFTKKMVKSGNVF
jgi:hypothetical protein